MNRKILTLLFILITIVSFAQDVPAIELNKEYPDAKLDKTKDLKYSLKLAKGGVYLISVLQQGIDVKLIFTDENNKPILEKDSPNGQNGYERFEYTPTATNTFYLAITRLDEAGNTDSGRVTVIVKQVPKAELLLREKIKKEMEPENNKTVQTLDIDHFWEAFDKLEKCKT